MISVITINYNNKDGLARTIESVAALQSGDVEHIIIDGGSGDGSFDVIQANISRFSYWVSEKDRGIYHAMNKGIEKAKGEYLLFLNSGDNLYGPDSLDILLRGSGGEDIVYGDMIMQGKARSHRKEYPDELSFGFFYIDTLPHQGSLIRRELFEQLGLYNERNKMVSDWEFFMNAVCLHKVTYRHIPEVVAVFHEDGMSFNPANSDLIQREKEAVYADRYGAFLPDYLEMDRHRHDLANIQGSSLHRLVKKIQESGLFRLLKK